VKYISLILFVVALSWTWHLVHSDSPVSFETHSGIQEKLANLIVDTIKSKRANASDIVIQKIWTEVVSSEKVKAFFVYSFKDNSESGPVTSEIKGEGLLEHQGEDAEGNDRWVLTKVQTSSDAIQFDDATIITGSPNGTAEVNPEAAPAAPTENKTEEEHK
jgi:hypothetical protein